MSFPVTKDNHSIDMQTRGLISLRYKEITKAINRTFWNSDSDTTHSRYVGSYGRGTATCVLLSETICGYNMLNGAGNTPDSITHFIETQLGIKKENICVDMIDNI